MSWCRGRPSSWNSQHQTRLSPRYDSSPSGRFPGLHRAGRTSRSLSISQAGRNIGPTHNIRLLNHRRCSGQRLALHHGGLHLAGVAPLPVLLVPGAGLLLLHYFSVLIDLTETSSQSTSTNEIIWGSPLSPPLELVSPRPLWPRFLFWAPCSLFCSLCNRPTRRHPEIRSISMETINGGGQTRHKTTLKLIINYSFILRIQFELARYPGELQ